MNVADGNWNTLLVGGSTAERQRAPVATLRHQQTSSTSVLEDFQSQVHIKSLHLTSGPPVAGQVGRGTVAGCAL